MSSIFAEDRHESPRCRDFAAASVPMLSAALQMRAVERSDANRLDGSETASTSNSTPRWSP